MIFSYCRAEIFNREHLLRIMLKRWRRRWVQHAGGRAADTLHRQHTLKKGMNAFKWAISRSRIQIEILQSRARAVLVQATFIKVKLFCLINFLCDYTIKIQNKNCHVTFAES